ncbi:MAG: DegT/DnrJ/EryC1/StrS family aminotransferase [Nanoarchaeota archaeon]
MLISQQKITPEWGDLLSVFKRHDKAKDRVVIKRYIPHQYLYWTGSGREALRQILLDICGKKNIDNGKKNIINGKKNTNKISVGIPAYTCHVVLDAVKRAGCQPIFYDSGVIAAVSEIKKITKKVDVLLLCYNFGFLPEIDKIVGLCRQNKVLLIEDCAQALGAEYKGKLAGSFGDYAFYSFGISKNIGFCGGMIASNNHLELVGLKKFPKSKLAKISGEALTSGLFFNKRIYRWTKRFLRKELIKKQEALDYRLPTFARKIVLNQLRRYDNILKTRGENADFCCREFCCREAGCCRELGRSLKISGRFTNVVKPNVVRPAKNSNPAWLYFVILSGDREFLIDKLLKESVEVGKMLTFRCLDGKSRQALKAEKEVLTFALYRKPEEVEFIVNKLKPILAAMYNDRTRK